MENHKMVKSVCVKEEIENNLEEQEEEDVADVGSSMTLERVAAAKKFIEDHYRSQMKLIQQRKERYAYKNLMLTSFLFRFCVVLGLSILSIFGLALCWKCRFNVMVFVDNSV